MKQRILNLLIAFDQFLWVVLTFGKGYPDETISAAAWRMEQQGKFVGKILRLVIDFLFLPLERDHCRKAYESEVVRNHLHPVYKS